MAFLRNISDRFWGLVSPRKTQQRRDKPFKALPTPRKSVPRSSFNPRSMSPATRVNSWNMNPTSPSLIDSDDLDRSLTPTSLERPYTDFEGDTLIDQLMEEIPEEDAWDANEETIVVDDGDYELNKAAHDDIAERKRREEEVVELRATGWAEDAVFVYQKVKLRGFEPLMPKSWASDFDMMPSNLFTNHRHEAFIKPALGSNFRGTKALKALLELGPRTRDSIISKAAQRTPEDIIRRGVWSYLKWATTDGKVDGAWNLPILAFESGPKNMPTAKLHSNMLARLSYMGSQFKDAFRIRSSVERDEDGAESVEPPSEEEFTCKLPTLYGVIVSHTVMAFVCYDILALWPSLRMVAIFDYGQDDYDVWNSLAVAILVIHCRNKMMELAPMLSTFSSGTESDPDA
ncbi:uncharacterized protein BDZ99DRAFT_458136 [Mytilinidion resinicola]|uniref:Uncharacterized protein n=1 Tax=Mytilinidion resinicola TaxID=574789 RepID=A0A6A6Z7M1_9PEZI|nr:uncharacterized protein BDZ99DRAFT_458136 [Mytilinidion resinicola]KAF2816255.1 hypothetical protein BDZ99DRAFT_458136 [Mytilinidion resinicola]